MLAIKLGASNVSDIIGRYKC